MILLSIASHTDFITLFLGPAKRCRQSSIYSPTSMDYSLSGVGWGGGGWGRGGGVMSHKFEPLYSFVEIIFSLMRVFSKYLIKINKDKPFVRQRYSIH